MDRTGEIPNNLGSVNITPTKETEPNTTTKLVVSTDISSGEYLYGIKTAPLERDDGLALLMIRNAQKEHRLNPLLMISTFANVSGERTYKSLEKLAECWGENSPAIVMGAIKAGTPNTEAVVNTLNLLTNSTSPISLVALGAFTDIAEIVYLSKEGGFLEKISEVVLTAPTDDVEGENLSFNSKADPEALNYLKKSGVTLVYGWNGVLQHTISRQITQKLESSNDPLDRYVSEGLETRNIQLARASRLSTKLGKNLPGVLPQHETRGGRMCIQDMIIPVYLTAPELFRRDKTDYGYNITIIDHEGVDKQVQKLLTMQ